MTLMDWCLLSIFIGIGLACISESREEKLERLIEAARRNY
jgi:Na+/H+-dicarboxylate symporter